METDIKADPKIVRKARTAYFAGLAATVPWNLAVFFAVDGYGRLFHIDIHITAFFVLRLVILVILAVLFISFITVFFVDPYVQRVSGAESYHDLMETWKERQDGSDW